jgi:hypothetical protein
LRSSDDVAAVLRYVRDGDLLLQQSLTPESRYRYELPYLSPWIRLFRDPIDPYLDSPIFETPFQELGNQNWRGNPSALPKPSNYFVYQIPYHAAEVIDARLQSVNVRTWTRVSVSNTKFAKLLSLYLQFEYPIFPFFQKDIFLDDLVAGEQNFCSSLLVNAILATACVSRLCFLISFFFFLFGRGVGADILLLINLKHLLPDNEKRVEFWNPDTLGYAFMAEARRLWEFEVGRKHITNVQAALILGLRHMRDGSDKVGLTYLFQSVTTAESLQIFLPAPELSKRTADAYTVTAWALFSWQR